MDIVEKVARAMCDDADDNWDWSVFYIVDARDNTETGRDVYRSMARAAIKATLEHLRDNVSDWMRGQGALWLEGHDDEDATKCFRAMINQALKEIE